MLAEEHILIYWLLLDFSCLQADVTRNPALHKHFNVNSQPMQTGSISQQLTCDTVDSLKGSLVVEVYG